MLDLLRKSLEIYPASFLPPYRGHPIILQCPLIWMRVVEGPLYYSSYLGGSLSELRQDRKGLKPGASSGAAFRK